MNNKQFFAVGLLLSALWIGEAQGMGYLKKWISRETPKKTTEVKLSPPEVQLSPVEAKWFDLFDTSLTGGAADLKLSDIVTLFDKEEKKSEIESMINVRNEQGETLMLRLLKLQQNAGTDLSRGTERGLYGLYHELFEMGADGRIQDNERNSFNSLMRKYDWMGWKTSFRGSEKRGVAYDGRAGDIEWSR